MICLESFLTTAQHSPSSLWPRWLNTSQHTYENNMHDWDASTESTFSIGNRAVRLGNQQDTRRTSFQSANRLVANDAVANQNKRRNIPISYILSHSLSLSLSTRNRLHKHKACENEKMGFWEENVTVETRLAQSLFPLNAPERFKQDKALIAKKKKGKLRKSTVMRKDKRESVRQGEILKLKEIIQVSEQWQKCTILLKPQKRHSINPGGLMMCVQLNPQGFVLIRPCLKHHDGQYLLKTMGIIDGCTCM